MKIHYIINNRRTDAQSGRLQKEKKKQENK